MEHKVLEKLIETTVWGQPVRFPSGGGEMVASLHRPPEYDGTAAGTKYPALMIVHGLGGSRHDFNGILLRAAIYAALNGFTVLRVDFRGHGESTGNSMSVTLSTLLADFNTALDYLNKVEGVDTERISVLGLSLGGTVAAIGASRRSDVKNLVMWESPYDLMGTFRRLLGPLTMMMIRTHGYLQAGLVQVSAEFCDQFEKLKPDDDTAKYKGRVLLVHGSRDFIVLPEESEKWKASFRKTECKLQLIEGADHPFTKEPWANEAIKHTLSWLGVVAR